MFDNVDKTRFWQTVINTIQEGLLLIDQEGRILFANKTIEKILGYSAEEIRGKSCEIFECENRYKNRSNILNKYCSLFEGKQDKSNTCVFKKKDGKEIHLLRNASVIKDRNGLIIGAVECLIDLSKVVSQEKEITKLRRQLNSYEGAQKIIGSSPAMYNIYDLTVSAAKSDASIIIFGEAGTGKELLANAIHQKSSRRNKKFVKVNCAALNDNLLESEMFGHVKGAFNGAEYNRMGKFEDAQGGSIFLDEIGDLPMPTQTKLLRVLRQKEIERVGGHRPIKINVRVIAATHKDLRQLISEGKFREDLFYLIGVIPIHIPPLRERTGDLPLLIENYIRKISERTKKPVSGITGEAFAILNNYSWPGNIRELINVLEYAFVLCSNGNIDTKHLPADLLAPLTKQDTSNMEGGTSHSAIKKQQLIEALHATGGNQTKAAELLGVSRVTVWKRMKRFGITQNMTNT